MCNSILYLYVFLLSICHGAGLPGFDAPPGRKGEPGRAAQVGEKGDKGNAGRPGAPGMFCNHCLLPCYIVSLANALKFNQSERQT